MMHQYPEEVARYIETHVSGTTTRKLSEDLNDLFGEKYGMTFTPSKIKSYKANHKLKSGTKNGVPKGTSLIYPDGMLEFVQEVAPGKSIYELTDAVNEKYGPGTITKKSMACYKRNHKIKTGYYSRFENGHIPANKGGRMSPQQYEKCKGTMFQKGHVPANKLEVGDVTRDTYGYSTIKVSDNGGPRDRFKHIHRVVWEWYHGKVPEGQIVAFLDGNKQNTNIKNLVLIDQATNLEMNRSKLRYSDADLTQIGINIASIKMALRDRRSNK